MSRGPVIGTIFAWWYQRGDGESMAATVNLFGMRARRTLQQGLGFIRSSITWRSSGAPSQQPWKQAPRGLLASKPNYFQFNRSELCSQGSAITFEGEDAQEADDSVTEELELGEQEWCLEEPKACLTHADYLSFTDKSLLAQCVVDTYRASGAGGQHRNKTDSAVRLKHSPTGLVGQAADDRSQHVNKALALNRLRQVIAIKVRRPVDLNNYEPSPELLRILPAASTIKREKGVGQQIGPKNSSYVNGMQTLLDLLCALNGSVSEAAPRLGLSTGMLSKLITSDRTLWQAVNAVRALKGLKPLR